MDDITNSMGMKLGTLWEMEKDRKAWSQTVRNDLATAHTHTHRKQNKTKNGYFRAMGLSEVRYQVRKGD